MPESPSRPVADGVLAPLPRWLRRTVAYGIAALVAAAVVAVVTVALLRVGVVAFALLAALLLTALLAPVATGLRRLGLPRAVAALAALLLLLGVPVGIGWLLYSRVMVQLEAVGPAVTAGLDRIREWLVTGPLGVDPARIDELRTSAFDAARAALPSPVAGTTTALHVLTGLLLVVFAVFFLAKDGDAMWRWFLSWVPEERRARVDGGGRLAWSTVTAYVRGTVLVALGDAVGIGLGLLVLGVPLWLSLALLTFVSAFVPIVGATIAGAAAVLVTLVTNGATDALLVLGLVLLVQQLEGNLLQPLVMSGVVKLHPLVTVSAVTVGTLLLGIAGAVLAVPVVAVGYRLVSYLAGRDHAPDDTDDERGGPDDPEGAASRRAPAEEPGPAILRGSPARR
ncbi:AI-2E family transporter [Aquipuribacter nitratireducens]|uniref:AI-2E family transporter n=1 Tax=Aquipuribacter nitratireducens TaxID=650104 RepID=A0ABW0GL75_9MICO